MEQSDKEMLLNPLASVKPNGILGFRLGDKREKVFDRIKELDLFANYEDDKIIIRDEKISGISRIQLDFNARSMIYTIIVFINHYALSLQQVLSLLILYLKTKPKTIGNNMFECRYDFSVITICYLTEFSTSNDIELSFSYN